MGLFRKGSDNKRKFKMREDLLSFGDDYWIEDEGGAKAFHVNGKALRALGHREEGARRAPRPLPRRGRAG